MNPVGGEKGQALVELQVGCLLAVLTLVGSLQVLRAEWERLRCAHLVFQATHDALHGEHVGIGRRFQVRIAESEDSVSGEAWCGKARETVTLKRLHAVRF